MMIVTNKPTRYEIATLNWPEAFPYRPEVSVELWHGPRVQPGEDVLHLHYRVAEKAVRGVCAADREHAWEDSCVEFFFAPREDGMYYNVECTCTGKLYMCVGADRHERSFLPEEAYAAITRRCSLGTDPVGLIEAPAACPSVDARLIEGRDVAASGVVVSRDGAALEWEVELEIPASVFGLERFSGLKARCNFYKCGDKLPERHFVTMFPIATERPDYHRPEFFGEIAFE